MSDGGSDKKGREGGRGRTSLMCVGRLTCRGDDGEVRGASCHANHDPPSEVTPLIFGKCEHNC